VEKQIVLVSGCSSGIGKETVLSLIREGHEVHATSRNVERIRYIQELGGHPQAMDVTNETQMQEVVRRIIKERGRIDVLINNAGYPVYGAIEDISLEEGRRQFEVNLFGLARLTQLVLPTMRRQRSGKIINMCSMGGKIYTPLGAWYHASKHAVEGWSDCLRLETAQHGIAVVLIEPGIIHTDFATQLVEPMLERSRQGAYAQMAQAMAEATRNAYRRENSSPPVQVAQVIAKVVRLRRPRTRYVVGRMAKSLLFVRKFLGDRAYDKLILSKL
jgi:NAD(P)-dependent dehydrogenase (short-subunit alcohol dehydrogenase family)